MIRALNGKPKKYVRTNLEFLGPPALLTREGTLTNINSAKWGTDDLSDRG